MTTDKAFKRVVRARMAKTGERYAAARRTLVEGATDGHHAEPTAEAATPSGYRMRGGLHPETATLANVLANQGVVSGLTGEPLTEAAILGIGGGLGAGYILWEFKSHGGPVLTLGFRNQWQYPSIPGWTGKTLDRLGIEPDLHETGGAKGAREALDARLDAGVPVIASVDLQSIGTWGQPDALSGYFGLVVVVFGRDDDGSYLVDDRGRDPFRVSPAVMAAARGRIGSFKHRIVGLRTTPGADPGRTASGGDARWSRGPGGPPALPIGLVLAPGLAQVGPTDDRRAEREGVAAGLRRRPRLVRLRSWPCSRASTARSGHGVGTCESCMPHRSTKRPSRSTTLRSATRRGRGGASPTSGRSWPTRPSRPISTAQPRRSRRSRHFTRR